MRKIYYLILVLICLIAYSGCNDNGNGPNGNGKETKISQAYFQVQDGNKWSYNNGSIMRELSGDTVVNGITCARLLENGATTEAWTLTDAGFAQHLLDEVIWVKPPLAIPLDLKLNEPYDVNSFVYAVGGTDSIGQVSGTLTYKGYVSREINDTTYDSILYLDYDVDYLDLPSGAVINDKYQEYYALGIGLVHTTGYLDLDYAVIDGDTLP